MSDKFEVAVVQAKGTFLKMYDGDDQIWNRELGFAIQILRGSSYLQNCSDDSIKNALVNVALTGITLNPAMALAYFVPRDGKCCLDFSYRGLLKIATDSGSVKSIQSNVVFDFDEFEYEEGTDQRIHFKRNMDPPADFKSDPLKAFWSHLLCAYSIATLHDGTKDHMIMPKWRIEKIWKSSKAQGGKSPWQVWPEEMTRKTVIKYHSKTLPQTERMSTAVAIVNEVEGVETTKQQKAASVQSRFETVDAEIVDTSTGEIKPAICDACGGLLIEGHCYNEKCPQGEPPPEVV